MNLQNIVYIYTSLLLLHILFIEHLQKVKLLLMAISINLITIFYFAEFYCTQLKALHCLQALAFAGGNKGSNFKEGETIMQRIKNYSPCLIHVILFFHIKSNTALSYNLQITFLSFQISFFK